MSVDALQAFLQAVRTDDVLQATLKAAADLDAVVAIAKEAGYAISAEELQKAQAELSDEELAGLAGGATWSEGKDQDGLELICDCGLDDCDCTH